MPDTAPPRRDPEPHNRIRSWSVDTPQRRAGVSKGGLLYHYPNKEALVAALLDRFDALAQEEIEAMKTTTRSGPSCP